MRTPTLGRHARNAQQSAHPELWVGTDSWPILLGRQGESVGNAFRSNPLVATGSGWDYVQTEHGLGWQGNGSTDYLEAEGHMMVEFTHEVLIVPQSFASPVVSIRDTLVNNIYDRSISIDSSGFFSFWIWDGAVVKVKSLSPITVGREYHVVGAVDANTLELIVDGVSQGTAAIGTITVLPTQDRLFVGFGDVDVGAPTYGDCIIRGLNIYDTRLGVQAVKKRYEDFVAPFRLRPTYFGMAAGGGPTLKTIAENFGSVENLQIEVSPTLNDLGSAAEAPKLSTDLKMPESGAGLEGLSVAGSGQISVGDIGSGGEIIDIITALTAPDNGSGLDTIDIAAQISFTESGAGSDTASISVILPITEIANGLDTLSLLAAIGQADTGSGTDTLIADTGATLINITEVTTGIETLTITANLVTTESGTALETLLANTGIVAQIIRMAAIAMTTPRMANVVMSVPGMANVVLTV